MRIHRSDARFLDRLLSAEPGELRGEGDSEVARSVRAKRVLAEMRALDAAFAAIGDAHGAAAAARPRVERADRDPRLPGRVAAAADREADALGDRGPVARSPRVSAPRAARSASQWRSLGLAVGLAAAGLAAFALVRPKPAQPPAALPSADPVAASPAPLTATLAVESDRRFAVFATDNPNIAVVWLFEEEGP